MAQNNLSNSVLELSKSDKAESKCVRPYVAQVQDLIRDIPTYQLSITRTNAIVRHCLDETVRR